MRCTPTGSNSQLSPSRKDIGTGNFATVAVLSARILRRFNDEEASSVPLPCDVRVVVRDKKNIVNCISYQHKYFMHIIQNRTLKSIKRKLFPSLALCPL